MTLRASTNFHYTSEYGIGVEVSIKRDMYSFRILILQMLTGKRLTDKMFKDDYNLPKYVESSIPNNLLQITYSSILPKELQEAAGNKNLGPLHLDVVKCLLSLFRITFVCSMESERMIMVDATRELYRIKSSFPSTRQGG